MPSAARLSFSIALNPLHAHAKWRIPQQGPLSHEIRVRKHPARRRRVSAVLGFAVRDLALSGCVAGVASGGVYALQRATEAGLLDRKLNRKLVHVAAGPLMIATWPLYSSAPSAALAAAAVPALFIGRIIYSAYFGRSLAASLSRSDNSAAEAVRGPLFYVLVILISTLAFWQTPMACCAVSQLAFGDGFADISGRYFGKGTEWKLPWAGGKTVVGSLGFVVAALFGNAALLAWFHGSGFISGEWLTGSWAVVDWTLRVLGISLACATVELIPAVDDNISIPCVAALLAFFLHV